MNKEKISETVTLKELIHRDYVRLKDKGIRGIVLSLALLIFLVQGLASFYQAVWPFVTYYRKLYQITDW